MRASLPGRICLSSGRKVHMADKSLFHDVLHYHAGEYDETFCKTKFVQ